jgi:hypothetical protein
MLIGMDIISLGDFALTNFGAQTVFPSAPPPKAHIDFTESV